MKEILLIVSVILGVTCISIQIYYAEKYHDRLSWNRKNINVSYWKMICDLEKDHPRVANRLKASLGGQIIAFCSFILVIKLL